MHTKESLEKLSREKLIAMLMFLLAITKRRNKRAYKQAEKIGLGTGHRKKRKESKKAYELRLAHEKERLGLPLSDVQVKLLRKEYGLNGKKKGKSKRKGNPRAKRALAYAHSHGVSLKEAWAHVKGQ